MRLLLDECLPFELGPALGGHDVQPVARLGWAGTKNGALLRRAVEHRFDAFITIDKRLGQQQVVPAEVAIITLRARSNRMADLRPLLPSLLDALARVRPGELLRVGA